MQIFKFLAFEIVEILKKQSLLKHKISANPKSSEKDGFLALAEIGILQTQKYFGFRCPPLAPTDLRWKIHWTFFCITPLIKHVMYHYSTPTLSISQRWSIKYEQLCLICYNCQRFFSVVSAGNDGNVGIYVSADQRWSVMISYDKANNAAETFAVNADLWSIHDQRWSGFHQMSTFE